MGCGLVLFCLLGTIETKPALVTTEVFFRNKGPYRFLVDTGSETTLVDAALAAELGLRPAFRTEVVNVHGGRFVPGARVRDMMLAGRALPELEVLFDTLHVQPPIRGVLGVNALADTDYLLSPADGRIELEAARPDGEAAPYELVEGRMVLQARMGGETLRLVLDSGASHVVLFRLPAAMARTPPVASIVNTLDGARSVAATTWTAELVFGSRLKVGTLPAALVRREGSHIDGLLPAAAFKKVFVDQARREVVLVR